ncbi:hypothetical protein WB44_00240 [Synechococcus sp. WH 8020]|nr:hypothetical protein WB44_00240 [Synechococcus sp. WH 8020]
MSQLLDFFVETTGNLKGDSFLCFDVCHALREQVGNHEIFLRLCDSFQSPIVRIHNAIALSWVLLLS